ncbi:hypothetical protein PRZ48_011126 [Zasmidium cellare]|uniref:DUF6594 domain-containing protein n=1 Tax=Zasmidium cellare TaxID=395010 RepID=A0ABR0EAI6_ZASCE|nr:hypothetical protein PRZ48_011126 [Zasmidium cellare]
MPETTNRASPHAPPKLVVSRPAEDVASSRPTLASRRRSQTESSARSEGVEWIDVDEDTQPRRRKRSSKRSSTKRESGSRSRRSTESEVSRFFPSLTRILESSESRPASRPGTSGSDSRKQREGSVTTHRRRHRDDSSSVGGYRRPVKHRIGGVSRRAEPTFKVNPSLLSVLTSLTGNSDSSSSTTITQRSYDRRSGEDSDREERKVPETENRVKKSGLSPNVFDYMDATPVEDGHDGASIYSSSSSSSHYEASDAGSSELPETPSSHSTFPSPTATRNSSLTGSVAELRRKYDSQYASSAGSQVSARSSSYSPESSTRSLKKLDKIRDVAEDANEASTGAEAGDDEKKRSSSISSRSSRGARRDEERLRHQTEAMRHHQARSQHGQHLIDPVYGQHRSHSASSTGSTGSGRAYAQYMAMQQYQYPSPPVPMAYPIPPQATNGHVAHHPDRPPVPDAPDLSQRTLAGYEQLAVELSKEESPVKPLYRKFEFLNHRILLHLQDELSELEEQLRTIDEIIAQMEPLPSPGQKRPPASRRGDAFSGSEIHHQRTALLGRIFLKTEQYNRALSSFRSITKGARPAEKDSVSNYKEYLKTKSPIHEIESRFLQHDADLIALGHTPQPQPAPQTAPLQAVALTSLPIALMLPLLLFALIPSLAGRLVVTALIGVGAFMVAATVERVRDLMAVREWAVCGAVYVLVMAGVAGCVPGHA